MQLQLLAVVEHWVLAKVPRLLREMPVPAVQQVACAHSLLMLAPTAKACVPPQKERSLLGVQNWTFFLTRRLDPDQTVVARKNVRNLCRHNPNKTRLFLFGQCSLRGCMKRGWIPGMIGPAILASGRVDQVQVEDRGFIIQNTLPRQRVTSLSFVVPKRCMTPLQSIRPTVLSVPL
jgi:hypothetical protein